MNTLQEYQRFNLIYTGLSIDFNQQRLLIKHRNFLVPIVMLELGLEQISHIKLRKHWIWFGKQGFEINYRKHPNDALLGFFFVSKQPQAWIEAFRAVGIKIIPNA
ncbi:hypothetical protein [Herpetosiphon gulosus]|uniref:Uncharacterized protein n=1 Tax=Herpetosiphon gulosus TaxID=1973496 RepID=A0ABP9X6B9_9CHLR